MELSFVLASELNVTLFDERVSAISDHDEGVKLVAKKDMLARGFFEESSMSQSLIVKGEEDVDATYSLTNRKLLLKDVIVDIDVQVSSMGKMDLLTLSHGGRLTLVGENEVAFLLVSETGEVDAKVEHDHGFVGEWTTIRMFMFSETRMVLLFNGKELFWDVPKEIVENIEIKGFLGRISNTNAAISSIIVYDRASLDRLTEPTNESQEALEMFNAYKNTKSEPQTQNTMGETAMDMFTRITGLSPLEVSSMDRKKLLATIYNGLNKEEAYSKLSHDELLNKAHMLCSKLLVGEEVKVDTTVVLDGSYRTFEFGELNKDNCTAEKLLYLVRKYPDVWLKRIQ